MDQYQLTLLSNDADLARSAAADCAASILSSKAALPFLLALSGGRVAKRFCAELAAEGLRRRTNFPNAHFFWADERCVPPTDPESNFALAQTLLIAPLGIESERVHRIHGELPPAEAANQAAEVLNGLARQSIDGQPVFDLILLGMGEDGHVASLFPGETAASVSSPEVYRPVVASKPPPNRITLGYAAIAAAREVWVLVSGPGKEAALRQSLEETCTTPLGRVIASRTRTRILTAIRI